MRHVGYLAAAFIVASTLAHADDGLGLRRGARSDDVTISGVSSGAAMAVQYAVAHSASIAGVGSIAGPGWGCADGRLSQAVNVCMCAFQAPEPRTDAARQLASEGAIDALASGNPQALHRAFVFQSAADAVVVERSGEATIAFLGALIGTAPDVDWGNAEDDSDHAGHGIIATGGTDACRADGAEKTYVRHCGAEDNVRDLFRALYPDVPVDPSKRVDTVPESDVWEFDQKRLIEEVKAGGSAVSWDDWSWFYPWLFSTPRRKDFDMAATGYLYVPPSCRQLGQSCRVHIALHGCKQNAKEFAATAGYNNWADYYKTIIVYPAVEPSIPVSEGCQHPISSLVDSAWIEPNPNGCWDWWGYLDTGSENGRYLTKTAPQMQVIEGIIKEVTAPLAAPQ